MQPFGTVYLAPHLFANPTWHRYQGLMAAATRRGKAGLVTRLYRRYLAMYGI